MNLYLFEIRVVLIKNLTEVFKTLTVDLTTNPWGNALIPSIQGYIPIHVELSEAIVGLVYRNSDNNYYVHIIGDGTTYEAMINRTFQNAFIVYINQS